MHIQPLKYEFSPLISAFGSTSVRGYGLGASVPTPTPTPTPTLTPTPTSTPTRTPTSTPTRTPTPTPTRTPTPTPTPCPSSFYDCLYHDGGTGIEDWACQGYYYSCFYINNCTGQLLRDGTTPFSGYVNIGNSTIVYYSVGYQYFTSYCPTPTPTPTPVPLTIGNNYSEYGGRYIGYYWYTGTNLIDSGTSYENPYIQWKVNGTYTYGADNEYDGYSNTYNNYDSIHPAFQYAGDLSKDGFYDWYIASPEELVGYLMASVGQGSDSLYYDHYWASMEYLGSGRSDVAFNYLRYENRWSMAFKTSERSARPIRRS